MRKPETGEMVILKAYRKFNLTAVAKEAMQKEVEVLSMLAGCPYAPRFDCIEEESDYFYLHLAKAPGRTLMELISDAGGRLGELALAADVVQPLLTALAALHGQKIVHRDLRPEHVICCNGRIQLLDFASAAMMGTDNLVARAGHIAYMAPEVAAKPQLADVFHMVIDQGMSEEELPAYNEKVRVCLSQQPPWRIALLRRSLPLPLLLLVPAAADADGAAAAPLLAPTTAMPGGPFQPWRDGVRSTDRLPALPGRHGQGAGVRAGAAHGQADRGGAAGVPVQQAHHQRGRGAVHSGGAGAGPNAAAGGPGAAEPPLDHGQRGAGGPAALAGGLCARL